MGWVRGETLGKGGFGFVSIAKTNQDNNLTAVDCQEEGVARQILVMPLDPPLLWGLNHDRKWEKTLNILLEYTSGGCLADHILKGLLEITVSRCTKSILSALLHIHKAGYVHCDVKPHNVLLVGQDAKLADLGSCCKTSFDEIVVIPQIPTNNRISKEAKDFLTKCLVKYPTARWKSNMLLDHPFVKKADPSTVAGKYIIIIITNCHMAFTLWCLTVFTTQKCRPADYISLIFYVSVHSFIINLS
ncbi:mitogen-activated protein kinase kinase kinase 18 [Striga asiatica]|uniref:Mitogen-activated protein kinase kinase kinase 18 n=1 Tax=Striga asiatica TaxID=4170 RepID=A0A5A7P486_STRAF|nr:mitogen-activated protein kinase kinase kinase 18 [Striga asiatica]